MLNHVELSKITEVAICVSWFFIFLYNQGLIYPFSVNSFFNQSPAINYVGDTQLPAKVSETKVRCTRATRLRCIFHTRKTKTTQTSLVQLSLQFIFLVVLQTTHDRFVMQWYFYVYVVLVSFVWRSHYSCALNFARNWSSFARGYHRLKSDLY